MGEPDFLRHIVSKVLTPVSLDMKRLDEAQKLLAKAESKYGFSSYGGDPEKLADFLLSPDFTNLIFIIGIDLTKKLLNTVYDNYSSQKIKDAVKKILDELEGYNSEETNQLMMYK
ncbi:MULTISPECIES: hypothetical protein [Sulfurisphaera]|uniref:Uncharacterized protein n=2 Tax=Sulfurisphaera TaxID=69655 RepID=A0A650CGI6_SULOH|nr:MULTISPECIES: hypothetical protein [Sulfurisphaera]MBB5252555.1 hypothetical protein [Sulfurisphaera ohwakuensis]QGR17001.1 hypothetical protein D1869_07275 [Sulfurisphaera ohwakuensis]HII73276.1 hypothetical protein [Sulfurisphaera tokodaii]